MGQTSFKYTEMIEKSIYGKDTWYAFENIKLLGPEKYDQYLKRKYAEKCNKRILQIMIIVFAISSFLERFILVKAGANATRDHYISTTFLAISFFVYALKSNWNNEILALIGRRYSTWLYIMHPIFITLLSMVAGKFGVKSIYRCVAPIVVYCVTLVFLIVLQKVKIVTKSK